MTKFSTLDQMGNGFQFREPPKRIISLVPSQTELLYDIGLDQQLVGITKFCVHPPAWRQSKTIVGGTKNFHFDTIDQLNPDLIIGNKEENYEEGIKQLQQKYPVWMSDIVTFYDALNMIRSVSHITGRKLEGIELVKRIDQSFNTIKPLQPAKTLYLMLRDPWMAAAGNTFINVMMEKIGLVNVLSTESRYPEISAKRLRELNPDLLLLSTEPFPFSEKHIPEILEILPNARVLIVDGEMFSWYGSRLALAPAYFNSIQFAG